MANRKLILALDYNNLAFRAVFNSRYGNDYVKNYDTERECAAFARSLIKDIVCISKMFKPHEVYLLSDSKDPWRKLIYPEYKQGRTHDDLNMDNIYKTMDEVYDILKEYGYYRLLVNTAEADDLAAMLKSVVKSEQSSIIYVSSDADWRQLIDFDEDTKQFFAVYVPTTANKRNYRPLYVKTGVEEWLYSPSAFKNENSSAKYSLIQALQSESTMKLIEMDPQEVLIDKIMCGDPSDNIPSFHEFLNSSGKKVRVTKLKKEKLFECCGFPTNMKDLEDRVNDGSLERSFRESLKWDLNGVDINERFSRQRTYVELDPKLFPICVRRGFVDEMRQINRDELKFKYMNLNHYNIIKESKYAQDNAVNTDTKLNCIFNDLLSKPILRPKDI